MKCQTLFSGENKKPVAILSCAKFVQKGLKFKPNLLVAPVAPFTVYFLAYLFLFLFLQTLYMTTFLMVCPY